MDVINTVNNALKHARRDQDSESTFHTPLLNEERPSHAQYQRPKKWVRDFAVTGSLTQCDNRCTAATNFPQASFCDGTGIVNDCVRCWSSSRVGTFSAIRRWDDQPITRWFVLTSNLGFRVRGLDSFGGMNFLKVDSHITN